MSDHHRLVAAAKVLGYDDDTIRVISAAAEAADAAKIERMNAARAASGVLTPLEASAEPRRASELRQFEGRVRNATRFGYVVPKDGSYLDVHALDRALDAAGAPSEVRWDLKSAAASLHLIPR